MSALHSVQRHEGIMSGPMQHPPRTTRPASMSGLQGARPYSMRATCLAPHRGHDRGFLLAVMRPSGARGDRGIYFSLVIVMLMESGSVSMRTLVRYLFTLTP